MADTTYDEELDLVPGLKYLKNKFVTITGAPKEFDNAPAISVGKVDLERLDPKLKERIDMASRDWLANKELNPKGEAFPITSGFRETPQQATLFANRASNPNLVAPPGYSSHEKGFGIDILPHVPDTFLASYGLHRPHGKKDPVHVEINPNADFQPTMDLVGDEDLGVPGMKYTSRQGVYQPTTKEAISSQFEGLKSDLTSSDYYTNTLPKQVAALGDVVYGAVPAAVKFVGEPFAKLIDKLGDTKIATEALDKVTQFADRPIGKAFGITNDPAYNAEAANRMMDYVGKNMDKGADYIAKETGLPKSDVSWFMNAAMIAAAPAAARTGKKVYETGAEVLPKAGAELKAQYETVKGKVEEKFPSLKGEENPNLRSVGAAELSAGQLRQAKARELLDPIDLSRDQYTRNFADVNYAREKAKDAVTGEPIRQKYAQDNQKLINNLNLEVEATGAQKTGMDRSQLGEEFVAVTNAYKNVRKKAKDDAYTAADLAGETLQQVPYQPILNYIENIKTKRPTQYEQNSILKMVEEDLKANDPNEAGSVNLRQLEDVRSLINAETEFGTSNGFHGGKIKSEIDAITKDAGGTLYQEARALNNRYMKEFEETPAISNITANKKNTTERRVPIETLVEDSMLKGPRSRVEEIFKTLEKAGPEGEAMIAELRGVVAEQIMAEATKGVGRDILGNPIVNPTGLNNIITKLDKSGKLDLIFGKQGAERYRTLKDVAIDVKTVPEGSVNYSGTVAGLKNMAAQIATDTATSALAGFPAPVTTIGTMIYKNQKNKKELNKINEFLNYGKER
jgi:hypothetical protein